MRSIAKVALGLAAALLLAAPAAAIQFTPTGTSRLHTLGSGQPGAEWNTGGLGANGNLAYDANTGSLAMSAELDVLNFFDPSNGSCATDVGSNCSHNYATNLDITLNADISSISVVDQGLGFYEIAVNFMSTGGTDLTVVDPTDSTTVLSASWASGSFNGNPTSGLTVTGLFDNNSGNFFGDPTFVGFFGSITGAYASLFDSGVGSLAFGSAVGETFAFQPTIETLAQQIVTDFLGSTLSNASLASFTAEGQGQVFRVAQGQFVPEPGTALLALAGLGALAAVRRRRA